MFQVLTTVNLLLPHPIVTFITQLKVPSPWLSTSMKSILEPEKDKSAIQFVLWKFVLENMVELRFERKLSLLLTHKNYLMKRDKLVVMSA